MINNCTIIFNLNSNRVERQAPNKIQFDEEKFRSIKFELKRTQRSVAKQMEVSQSIRALQYQKGAYKVTQLLRAMNNAIANLCP